MGREGKSGGPWANDSLLRSADGKNYHVDEWISIFKGCQHVPVLKSDSYHRFTASRSRERTVFSPLRGRRHRSKFILATRESTPEGSARFSSLEEPGGTRRNSKEIASEAFRRAKSRAIIPLRGDRGCARGRREKVGCRSERWRLVSIG